MFTCQLYLNKAKEKKRIKGGGFFLKPGCVLE